MLVKFPWQERRKYNPIFITESASILCLANSRSRTPWNDGTMQGKQKWQIGDSQHGFTKGKYCLTNSIANFNDSVTALVDNGRVTDDGFYLDWCKAFDISLHNILYSKWRDMDLMDELIPKWRPVRSGMPQGSVLGTGLLDVIGDMDMVA